MANNKSFKIKNGLQAGRYLGSNGTETAGTVGYSIGSASYDSVSFSVASQTTSPYGVTFNSAGTKMYVLGNDNDVIYQYSLSTAWDVSSSSYDSVSLNVNAVDAAPLGIQMGDSNTKLYLLGGVADSIFQYTLSTASDLSTATYDSKSFSVSSQFGSPYGVAFSTDGTSFYVAGITPANVSQYNLNTAWDVSTANYDSTFSSAEGDPFGIALKPDGTKAYISSTSTDNVSQYSLSTAWDLSTISYDNISFSVASQDANPIDIFFKDDGAKMYIAGLTSNNIYQYSTVGYTQTLDLSTGGTFSFTPSGATTVSLTNPPASGTAVGFTLEVNNTGGYALTWPSSIKWHLGTAPTATTSKELYTFVTTDGGTTYYGKLAGSNIA